MCSSNVLMSFDAPSFPIAVVVDTMVSKRHAIQVQILKLMSSSIDKPAPNVAHLLLGFRESASAAAATTLQDPGKMVTMVSVLCS